MTDDTTPPNSENTASDRGREAPFTPIELQARLLRDKYNIAYCLACEIAPIVWGVAPR